MNGRARISGAWFLGLAAVVAAFTGSCGGGGGGATPSSSPPPVMTDAAAAGNYLPLIVGSNWTYSVTSASGATGQGTVTVEGAENAPNAGQPALRVHTILLDGGSLSWEQTSGSAVVRYEEQQLSSAGTVIVDTQYMPPILVLDESAEHLTTGAAWTETYSQLKTPSTKGKATKETTEWTVEAVGESVAVPAGTYSCIRVRRNHTSSKTPSDTVSWYAAGIGRVKETGAGENNDQTLELASVSMP